MKNEPEWGRFSCQNRQWCRCLSVWRNPSSRVVQQKGECSARHALLCAVWLWSDDNNGELGSSFSQGGRGHQSAVTIVFTRMGRATSIYSSSSYYLTSKRRCISKCKFYTISTKLAKCLQIKIDGNVHFAEARTTECLSLKYQQLKFIQKYIIFFKQKFLMFLISVTNIFQKVHQIEPLKLILELYLWICSAIYIFALELHHH